MPNFPLAAAMLAVLFVAACTSSTPIAYRGLASSGQLRPASDGDAAFLYRNSEVVLDGYRKMLIDPVVVYDGPDGQFGSVSPEDRADIARYMQEQFTEALGGAYQLVAAAEPDALRLRLTLTGIETSTPVISTVSHLIPVGLVINSGLQAADRNGTFFGSATFAVELSDAQSGALVYAYVTKQTPDALDVTASFGSLAATREAVRIGARHLFDRLGQKLASSAIAAAH